MKLGALLFALVMVCITPASQVFGQDWQAIGGDWGGDGASGGWESAPDRGNSGHTDDGGAGSWSQPMDAVGGFAGVQPADQGGDTDTRLARMAKRYAHAVGWVITYERGESGRIVGGITGTAWAIAPSVFATNAHVAGPVITALQSGGDAFVLINRSNKRLRVNRAAAHPRFNELAIDYRGKENVPSSYDVGLLQVDGSADIYFPIATDQELRKLDAGYPVAFLGFPTANLPDYVDLEFPIAMMQTGIIAAVTDYWNRDSGISNNYQIRHNLPATGGASGSPLFNTKGQAVGILSAISGYDIIQVTTDGRLINAGTAPNAAQVNYGHRADLIREFRETLGW